MHNKVSMHGYSRRMHVQYMVMHWFSCRCMAMHAGCMAMHTNACLHMATHAECMATHGYACRMHVNARLCPQTNRRMEKHRVECMRLTGPLVQDHQAHSYRREHITLGPNDRHLHRPDVADWNDWPPETGPGERKQGQVGCRIIRPAHRCPLLSWPLPQPTLLL